jgi:hypothetical protein
MRLPLDLAPGVETRSLLLSFIGRRGGGQVDSTCRRLEAPVQVTGAIFKEVLK